MEIVNKILSFLVKCFSIDESRSLHKNHSFWFALFAPVIFALFLGLNLTKELVINNSFDFGLTAAHLDSFINYYKFPIGLLPISILLSVMVARFHASKQTVQQTHLKNYFDHYSFFEAYCLELKETFKISIDARTLYLHLYTESSLLKFDANPSYDLVYKYQHVIRKILSLDKDVSFQKLNIESLKVIDEFENEFKFGNRKEERNKLFNNTFIDWVEKIEPILIKIYSFQGNRLNKKQLHDLTIKMEKISLEFHERCTSKYPKEVRIKKEVYEGMDGEHDEF
ncbi:hypothetical protein [Pseudoalteromonas neustonica]|uniref:hypothetical protein n=1 Tax=Pseudoalteromonas neustonica TaxID=1840331 RepID=UPI000A946D65|nr:hypothetical protein [Pseudoalteromonas neustonica]